MRKQALVILSRYLWPIDGGRKESLNHYLKELYDNYNYEITVLCFLEASQSVREEDRPYYINDVVVLKDIGIIGKLVNVVKYSLSSTKWPFQCALYYSIHNENIIKEYVKKLNPDLIFTEMIRTCQYYKAFEKSNAIKLANLDDLLSLRYMRQLQSDKSVAGFVGTYGDKLPNWCGRLLSGSIAKKLILKMESVRCSVWEKKFYELYDYSLMTSNVERDILNQQMGMQNAKTLTVGVDCDYYGAQITRAKDCKGLSYVGNFSVASNADTLKMLVEDILPLIKSDYKLYVIGKCPDTLSNRYKNNARIMFCGRVDDLREYVKSTAVFLSPIAYGTGIKTKIVEAMAMGMPVITNSVGVEGIHAKIGQDIIVCDEFIDIARETDRLLCDAIARNTIGNNARKFAENTFRWEKVFEVYKELGV